MLLRCLIAIVLVIASDARAQQQADAASEIELRAAHCLGVHREAIASLQPLPGVDDSAPLSAWREEARRLQSFLFVQGFGRVGIRGRQAFLAVVLAQRRGHADQKSCTTRIDMCVRACSRDSVCTDRCRDQDRSCGAVAACHSLNLPI